jgi:hypothetical protein
LAQILGDVRYDSTKANRYVWIRKAVKDNGHQYYMMLFVYTDNILALSHRAKDAMKEITKFYKAKGWKYYTTRNLFGRQFITCNYLTVKKYGQLHQRHM